MHIHARVPLLDDLLEAHRAALGGDYAAYRNHCCRVYHLAVELAGAARADLIAVACAFHDLGIWTDGTFDYLAPSAQRARRWLHEQGRAADADRVAAMIEYHHKLTPYTADPLVEAFRRADWIDVSLGALCFGVPRVHVQALQRAFPDAGFHWRLVQLTARQLAREPWRPLPMFRR